MRNDDKENRGVIIGNVTGGIHGSIISSGDIKNAIIALGGQPTLVDKEPSLAEFKQLLMEIEQELVQIVAQEEILKIMSPASVCNVQGTEDNTKEIVSTVGPKMNGEEAKSVQEYLGEVSELLNGVLNKTKAMTGKAGDVADATRLLVEKLEPLVEKVNVAVFWVAKL